ncbi:MAG: biopolymer transporter ExbD [Croceibacterium sp.]
MAMGLHASSRGRSARRAPMAEINVTPLVDVMLVLLIIFMVTAPMLASGVPVTLPDSRARALDQEADQVTLSIERGGTIYLDRSPVAAGELAQAVASIGCGTGADRLVTLRADKGLDYGRVMGVMGELNRAGCKRISLVTNGSVAAP